MKFSYRRKMIFEKGDSFSKYIYNKTVLANNIPNDA